MATGVGLKLDKKEILMTIIGAGINISPKALYVLNSANIDNQGIKELIQQISYFPNFNSLITIDVLRQTKYNQSDYFKKFKDESIKENQKISKKKNTETSQDPKKQIKKKHQSLEKNSLKKNLIKSESDSLKMLSDIENIDEENINDGNSKNDEEILEAEEIVNSLLNEKKSKSFITNKEEENFLEKKEISNKVETIEKKSEKTTRQESNINRYKDVEEKSKFLGSTYGGSSTFKPIAKDYYDEIKILKDPTKNLYTSGDISEFIHLIQDRFEKLKVIVSQHPDVKGVMSIKTLRSLATSQDIGLIGMVKEKRVTGENRHIKITLEDTTGEITAILLNNERNSELYNKLIYLVEDQVVYVGGYLKYDDRKRSYVIFINNIIWPDIPVGYKPDIPECPVSIALISDVHMGSKNFIPKLFDRFISYLKCEIGTEAVRKEAGKIKYLVIQGDLVDGIGIYPNQDRELDITDIFDQYKYSAELLAKIPDYIKIIYIPGNHEPIRNALPHPIIPKKYCPELVDLGVTFSGNPSTISLHGIKTLCYHGDSIIDMIMAIPGLKNENPEKSMEQFLRCRHLAPIYGSKTEIAPVTNDWLVIDEIPHLFHSGHVHINGLDNYRNVLMVNSGCFQSQTEFMKSLGIIPTPGFPVIVEPENGRLNAYAINLNKS